VRVDYAYATVSNIYGQPLWFSVGRRPSTGGIPSNIRQNNEKMGTAGIPSLMVNYAFDGMTLGYAPTSPPCPALMPRSAMAAALTAASSRMAPAPPRCGTRTSSA